MLTVMAALFSTEKKNENLKCLSVTEPILWYIHTMEEYSTINKSKGLIQAAMCLNHHTHSEEEASGKDQVLYKPHMGSSGAAMRNVRTEGYLTWAHGLQGSQSTVAEKARRA